MLSQMEVQDLGQRYVDALCTFVTCMVLLTFCVQCLVRRRNKKSSLLLRPSSHGYVSSYIIAKIWYLQFQTHFSHLSKLDSTKAPSKTTTLFSFIIMPDATHWKCHHCQHCFRIDGYVECPFCHHRKCHACPVFAARNRPGNLRSSLHSRSGDHARNHQDVGHRRSNTTSANHFQHDYLSEVTNQYSERSSRPRLSLRTDIYTCCQCSVAGPQVWQHNRKCSECGHLACSSCSWFK